MSEDKSEVNNDRIYSQTTEETFFNMRTLTDICHPYTSRGLLSDHEFFDLNSIQELRKRLLTGEEGVDINGDGNFSTFDLITAIKILNEFKEKKFSCVEVSAFSIYNYHGPSILSSIIDLEVSYNYDEALGKTRVDVEDINHKILLGAHLFSATTWNKENQQILDILEKSSFHMNIEHSDLGENIRKSNHIFKWGVSDIHYSEESMLRILTNSGHYDYPIDGFNWVQLGSRRFRS